LTLDQIISKQKTWRARSTRSNIVRIRQVIILERWAVWSFLIQLSAHIGQTRFM